MRQLDLAKLTGLSQSAVSRIERGDFSGLGVATYLRLVEILGAEVDLSPRWRGPKLAAILDARHAHLQNLVVAILESLGWVVRLEFSFNHYGDRGSVDIIAWHPRFRALLIIEIKPELLSVEETLRVLAMKLRLVPKLVGAELGWDVDLTRVASVLVLPANSQQRELVERHSFSFDAALPERTVAVRRWLRSPDRPLRGVWFVRITHGVGAKSKPATPDRVRLKEQRQSEAPRARFPGTRG